MASINYGLQNVYVCRFNASGTESPAEVDQIIYMPDRNADSSLNPSSIRMGALALIAAFDLLL